MTAELVKGAPIAGALRRQVVEALDGTGVVPCLANVVVGDAGASASYLDSLDRAAAKRGIETRRIALDADVRPDVLAETIVAAGADPGIHGLMIQMPLPDGFDAVQLAEFVPPDKDVDGLTTASLGRVLAGRPSHTAPATAAAVVEILRSDERLSPRGKDVVVVGRSLVVGRPLAAMLTRRGPGGDGTVTVCHTATADLAAHTARAELLVVAAGRQHVVTPDMVRPGAVVIDVGTHPIERDDGSWTLAGDVHPDVAEVAGLLTPVPGGVGIVTTAVLMRHVVAAALPGRLEAAW